MKRTVKLLLAVCMVSLATSLSAEIVSSSTTEYEPTTNPALCWLRGLSNVAMCWSEVPRCMVYDNAKIPVLGLGAGVIEGTFLTVFRALGGVYDIASFGCSGESIYTSRFPEYFWQSKWLPQNDTTTSSSTVIRENKQAPATATPPTITKKTPAAKEKAPIKTVTTTAKTVKVTPVVE